MSTSGTTKRAGISPQGQRWFQDAAVVAREPLKVDPAVMDRTTKRLEKLVGASRSAPPAAKASHPASKSSRPASKSSHTASSPAAQKSAPVSVRPDSKT